ncbi:MAG: c-type cytochrome [Myxococcota bacterium]
MPDRAVPSTVVVVFGVVSLAGGFEASATPAEPNRTLQRHGEVVSLDELPVRTGTFGDVLSGQRKKLRGYPARAVMNRLLPAGWADKEVVLRCRDGYAPRLPGRLFTRYDALFAFGFADDAPFEADDGTTLGPFYVVWPMDAEVPNSAYAYQVVGVEVIGSAEAPPWLYPSQPPAVVEGATLFRRHCISCHALAGHGGRVGPELHEPVPVAAWVEPKWLRRWLLEPQSMRRGTPMPGLPDSLPNRDQIAERIVDYLVHLEARSAGPGSR